jgi:hypothetical protein
MEESILQGGLFEPCMQDFSQNTLEEALTCQSSLALFLMVFPVTFLTPLAAIFGFLTRPTSLQRSTVRPLLLALSAAARCVVPESSHQLARFGLALMRGHGFSLASLVAKCCIPARADDAAVADRSAAQHPPTGKTRACPSCSSSRHQGHILI